MSLLKQLDSQKQKALEESFKELNSRFTETFLQIVPQGHAELKLVKNEASLESQKSMPTQFPDSSQVVQLNQKIYKGIKVKVNFGGANAESEQKKASNGVEEEGLGLHHLSGGQKIVVVVCLIFAVLKIESAPFYILDEFDHALDAQYRSSIAELIH